MNTEIIGHYKFTEGKKELDNIEYFNVILVRKGRVEQNNLFNDLETAKNNFCNILCEFSEKPMTKEKACDYLVSGYSFQSGGFIQISKPTIRF